MRNFPKEQRLQSGGIIGKSVSSVWLPSVSPYIVLFLLRAKVVGRTNSTRSNYLNESGMKRQRLDFLVMLIGKAKPKRRRRLDYEEKERLFAIHRQRKLVLGQGWGGTHSTEQRRILFSLLIPYTRWQKDKHSLLAYMIICYRSTTLQGTSCWGMETERL